ncbi:MAG: alpha/beta hydrolase [Bacteroidota bacterium]
MKTSTNSILRFTRSIIIAGIVALLFWSLIIMIFEEKLVFFPSGYSEGFYRSAAVGLNPADHWFQAEDGTRLYAWLVEAKDPLGVLLYFHGNAGNLAHRSEKIRRLRNVGLSVFIIDYRGYGRSEGSPTEDGVYQDARAAYDYLVELGVDSSSIIVHGTSLGGAVAADLAVNRPIKAMILESTFSSAADVASVAYPFLPARFLMRTRFDSESKLPSIQIPLLFIHGSDDSIIPIRLGRKLFDAAREPKEFHVIPGADHNDVFLVGGEGYTTLIRDFALKIRQK